MKPRTVKPPKRLRVFKFVRWYAYEKFRGNNNPVEYRTIDDFFADVIAAATYRRKFDAPR